MYILYNLKLIIIIDEIILHYFQIKEIFFYIHLVLLQVYSMIVWVLVRGRGKYFSLCFVNVISVSFALSMLGYSAYIRKITGVEEFSRKILLATNVFTFVFIILIVFLLFCFKKPEEDVNLVTPHIELLEESIKSEMSDISTITSNIN